MAGSNPNASQWSTLRRSVIPAFAASDIVQGAAVCVASNAVHGGWDVMMVSNFSQKPIGVARDYAIAGNPVAVFDDGNIVRANVGGNGVGGSVGQFDFVGIVGTSTMVHPQSGVTVTFPLFGTVPHAASPVGYGGSPVWAVGVSYEAAYPGDFSAFRVEPRTLSGNVSN
jgi:hypothetical protein